MTLDLLRALRSVTTIHYNPRDGAFAAAAAHEFPIEVQPSGVCSVAELATAVLAFDAALRTWPHYLAALLLDQKAEIPIPTATGFAFGSFAVMEGAADSDLKNRTAGFRAFRNALRVLYQCIPLADIFQRHGAAIAQYGTALTALSAADAPLRARLDALEADARALAAIEPPESFSHTIAMLSEIAGTGDWALLREQAERHGDSPSLPVALAARRMMALAFANGTERADIEAAIAIYSALTEGEAPEPTDFGSLALLVTEGGDAESAKVVVLRGIAACAAKATGYFLDIGHRIVEATGDRAFRDQLQTAIAERGRR